MLTLRPAAVGDCEAVADIYRHYVETSTASFDLVAPDEAQWRDRLAHCAEKGWPFLVVEAPEVFPGVLGFAKLGEYRGKAGWSWTTENSIYLRPEAAGRGIGGRLLTELLDVTDRSSVRHIMAVISDEVPESVALHRKCGFVETGRTPEVGRKFDRWVGAVYMHCDLARRDREAGPVA